MTSQLDTTDRKPMTELETRLVDKGLVPYEIGPMSSKGWKTPESGERRANEWAFVVVLIATMIFILLLIHWPL